MSAAGAVISADGCSTSVIRFFSFLSRSGAFLLLAGSKPPQPVTKYCITTVIILVVNQYSARPLGKVSDKKVNISGNITCIVRPCACCLGSVGVEVIIFCCAHIDRPTRIARKKSGTARFIHRNWLFKGSAEYTTGQS